MNKRKRSTMQHGILFAACTVLVAFLVCPALQAAELGGCVREVSGFSPVPSCTANDVYLTDIVEGSLEILDDGCTGPGDTVTFTMRGIFELTTNERYDVGIFISSDGDPDLNGAKAGACYREVIEGTPGDFTDIDGDGCADISVPVVEQPVGSILGPYTIQCVDKDMDGKVDILHCETWNQPGGDIECYTDADAQAGSPSKCNCGELPGACIAYPDDNACTMDVCAGTCSEDPSVICYDNGDCEGTCENITLQHIDISDQCVDGDACTADSCDPASGCVYTPISCDDSDACTTDSCDPATGCVNTPIICDDSSECTTDTCDPTVGCVYTSIDCDDSNECTADSCDPATGCVNEAIGCDDEDACTTDSCDSETGCVYTPITCDDGNLCTIDSCDPATGCVYADVECGDPECEVCDPSTGECVNICLVEEAICRTPGFYGTHAGVDPKKKNSMNITQALITAGGGSLPVCGMMLTNTDVGDPYSALETLCVSPQGDSTLQLMRQLTAMSLNCIISGGGADCSGMMEDTAGLFADCNARCDGSMSTRTVGQCINEVDCFNNGGEYVDGACYTGYCSDNTAYCSDGNLGNCADPYTAYCIPFPDSCHDRDLINPDEGLDFEPPGPAGSSKDCNEAIKNDK